MARKKKTSRLLHRYQTRLHNAWLRDYLPDLNESELKVYLVLAMHAHWEMGYAYPGMSRIARMAGFLYGEKNDKLDTKRVKRTVQSLHQKGLIEFEYRKAKDKDGVEYGRMRYFYTLKHPANVPYVREEIDDT